MWWVLWIVCAGASSVGVWSHWSDALEYKSHWDFSSSLHFSEAVPHGLQPLVLAHSEKERWGRRGVVQEQKSVGLRANIVLHCPTPSVRKTVF